MSIHIRYNHECPSCSAKYIPYDEVPCPRCGVQETDRFDFIPQAANSLLANKLEWGSFTPGAWAVTSFGDHIVQLLFLLFDGYAEEGKGESFDEFSNTGSIRPSSGETPLTWNSTCEGSRWACGPRFSIRSRATRRAREVCSTGSWAA